MSPWVMQHGLDRCALKTLKFIDTDKQKIVLHAETSD